MRRSSRCWRPATVITYNGEIYNYLELRDELATGWHFRSTSDTECILAAYERYGDRLPRPPARHVRFRDLGRPPQARCSARATASASSRSTTRSVGRSVCLCLRGKGAAAVPAGDRNRPGGARRIPDVPIHDRRSDPVRGRQAAAAGPCADRRERRRSRSGATGTSATRSISTTTRAISSAASSSCSTTPSRCICAATCRSAPMFRAASIRA